MKTIEIIVNPKGEITLQTQSFTGSTCKEASRLIEQALGIILSDRPTAEFYQSESVEERQQVGEGKDLR